MSDLASIKQDFPILQQLINGNPLIYLDSASSSQKPYQVIDAISNYYSNDNANIRRSVHTLSARATLAYEKVRNTIKNYINAKSTAEIIFVSGATAGINLVAHSYGQKYCQPGDEIILSMMEHHSNIVPWQLLAAKAGLVIKVIPLTPTGMLDLVALKKLFTKKTKLLAVTHISNVLGTVNPIPEIIALAHQRQVHVLIDGAQAIGHIPVDVQELDCEFYVFSGHKAYGPTGIGVLYGKQELLAAMPPYQGGGDMIATVSFEQTSYNQLPYKFEAGTPNIAGVIGLGAALDYLKNLGMVNIMQHEQQLLAYAQESLSNIPAIKILAEPKMQSSIISFVVDNIHPHDLGTILDHEGIAIRGGHHCAMPLMQHLNVPATARISLGIYNNASDIDRLVAGINYAQRLLGKTSTK